MIHIRRIEAFSDTHPDRRPNGGPSSVDYLIFGDEGFIKPIAILNRFDMDRLVEQYQAVRSEERG